MIKVGITGQHGFIGTHLYHYWGLRDNLFERIPFEDSFFEKADLLRAFVKKCDVIVHLAAVNRHLDSEVIYRTNIRLVRLLIEAMECEEVRPHVLFSSSIQEERDNTYGKSKRDGRVFLENWARRNGASFTGMVLPNVYGPFGRPNYNSFIATFCHNLIHGESPVVIKDDSVKLIYVGSLCKHIEKKILEVRNVKESLVELDEVPWDFEKKVTEILMLLEKYKKFYWEQGIIPALQDYNEVNLFNTFRSYINHGQHFPVKLVKHEDERGVFVETIRLGVGGQISFSTTLPGITRGNHYHTRKIERFTVIRGKAKIQLRRIGSNEVLNFDLDGEEPAYVDIPVWYTHNIINIGDVELYTQFWINEWYDPKDGDTYFEKVDKF